MVLIISTYFRHVESLNVLIYAGDTDTSIYERVRQVLVDSCIDTERYVIYRLAYKDALQDSWLDTCQLLVIADPLVWIDYSK